MELQFKTLTVHIAGGAETFQLAFLGGAEPAALLDAARDKMGQGITAASMFFTIGPDPSGVVVPLSAALPDGAKLTLHCRAGPDATALPSAQDESKQTLVPREQVASGSAPRRGRSGGPGHRGSGKEAAPVTEVTAGSEYDTLTLEVSDSLTSYSSQVGPLPGDSSTPLLRSDSLLAQEAPRTTTTTETTNTTELSKTDRGDEPRRNRSGSAVRAVLGVQSAEDRKASSDHVNAIKKFSRINTDQGNERTLLGWIRTALAAQRTVFSFYALVGTSNIWTLSVVVSEWSLAFLSVLLAVLGYQRYVKMKEIIVLKETPADFKRVSIRWIFWVTMISVVLSFIGSLAYTFGPLREPKDGQCESCVGWAKG